MLVGVDRFYASEGRDRSKNKFINNQATSNDSRTILPQALFHCLYGTHTLLVPTPGDPDEHVFDSLMQSIKESEERRGYSINADGRKKINRGNQVTQRNHGFAKTMVEIASVQIYCNDRGPMSNSSRHWTAQSRNAGINLGQIQACLINHLNQVMPDLIQRVFPGETHILAFVSQALLFLT